MSQGAAHKAPFASLFAFTSRYPNHQRPIFPDLTTELRRVRGHQHRWKPWNNDTFKVLPSYGPVVPMPSLDTFMTLIPEFVPARNGSPPVPCFVSPIATLSRAGQLRASPATPADAAILQEIRWPALELLVLDARTAPTLTTPTPAGEAAGYTPMHAVSSRLNLFLHTRSIFLCC